MIKYSRDVVCFIQNLLVRATRIFFTDLYESRNGETSHTSLDNETNLQFAPVQQVSAWVSMSLYQ